MNTFQSPLGGTDRKFPPTEINSFLYNIADGATYLCSSVEPGTPVQMFSGEPTASFKFHTKLEVNPWLLMDLGAGYLIRKIVVYNRSDACQDRAKTIQIEGSPDGMRYKSIYAADWTEFEGVWRNRPLVVNLEEPVFYRYLRFSLRAETYFHLDFIQVYAPPFFVSVPGADGGTSKGANQLCIEGGRTSRPLNILYISCHEILEYDDLSMFTDRGHRVFALGSFSNPSILTTFRKAKPAFFHPGDWEEFCRTGGNYVNKTVTAEFAKRFDVAIIVNFPHWVRLNLNSLHGIPIIYRSIGQSVPETEMLLAGLEGRINVIRYSQREVDLPGFIPADDVIYFGKTLPDRPLWNPGTKIVTFHNNYLGRDWISAPSLEDYGWLANQIDIELYGAGNDNLSVSKGLMTPEQQLQLYQNAAAYFYVYTTPPSYTLSFIEALATGTPIVAPTAAFIQGRFADFETQRYEIPDLLGNDSRVLYDTIEEAHEKLRSLKNGSLDVSLEISKHNFAMAQQRFDATKIAEQWDQTLVRIIRAF